MYKSVIYCIGAALLFSGCSRTSTNPIQVFNEVQTNISHRTGQFIVWDKKQDSCSEFKAWLEDLLKADLTLEKVVEISLINNQRLKGTYENLGIAQAQLVQAGLLKNPIFSLSFRCENLINSASILEMGLVQNFLDILLKPKKKKLASAELAMVKSEVSAHILDVIADAKIAYHELQSAEQVLLMRSQVLKSTEAAYEVAKRLNEAGNITNLDLVVERSNYEQMKIEVSVAEVDLFLAKERLNIVMGLWGANIDWKISQQISPILNEEMDFCSIENHVIANSLDLQISREKMRATALSLGIETSEIVFPEFTVGPDSKKEPDGSWFVGPQFSIGIPIFDIGLAKKAAGCAELSKQWNEYTALAIEIRSMSRVVSFRLLSALKQYQYFQSVIIPLEEQITKETLLQLNAMQLGVFDLLLVKQKEIETRLKSIYSYRDYWIARTEVEMLLSGRMTHNRVDKQ